MTENDITRNWNEQLRQQLADHQEAAPEDLWSRIEQQLDESFFRLGRSAIVNLNRISRVTKTDVFLKDGDRLILPRGQYEPLNRAIIDRL